MIVHLTKLALELAYVGFAFCIMPMGFIQSSNDGGSTVEHLIDRFGLPVAMLVVVGLFLWKGLWPFMIKRIEQNEAMLKEQINAAHLELKSARDYSAEITQKQTAILSSLVQAVDFIKQELISIRTDRRADETPK